MPIWRVEIFDAKPAPQPTKVGYISTVTRGQAVALIEVELKGGERMVIYANGHMVVLPLNKMTWAG